jgi:hypothetical protein
MVKQLQTMPFRGRVAYTCFLVLDRVLFCHRYVTTCYVPGITLLEQWVEGQQLEGRWGAMVTGQGTLRCQTLGTGITCLIIALLQQ